MTGKFPRNAFEIKKSRGFEAEQRNFRNAAGSLPLERMRKSEPGVGANFFLSSPG